MLDARVYMKMALIHRVNINFGFVLNTFYCKCIVNIKRCKTEYNIKSQTNVKYGMLFIKISFKKLYF